MVIYLFVKRGRFRSGQPSPWKGAGRVRVVPSADPLRRSTHNRILAGVCGGIAEWRGWRPFWVRVAFVVGSILPIVPGFVVYVVLWLLVKEQGGASGAPP